MSEVQHTITDLVVHKLVKGQEGPAGIELRSTACVLDNAAVRLVEQLCSQYASKAGKGYGHFEADIATFPMVELVRDYVVERKTDFIGLSRQMMELLQACADDELDGGGHVVISRIKEGDTDCLWVALVGEKVGSAVNGNLDIFDCSYLDLNELRAAGRIDLTGWQRGDERYISFLKGRGDVAGWFKRFIGCSDVVIALKETKKLVQTLTQFADTQHLEPQARDALMQRAHVYLDELGESGAPLAIDEVAKEVWPEQPEQLSKALTAEDVKLASGFVPDRRAIRPLVRFKASAEEWKLEFDRASLRSGAVQYDREAGTLVLSNLPDYLKQMLMEE